jgi:hypothetical protein
VDIYTAETMVVIIGMVIGAVAVVAGKEAAAAAIEVAADHIIINIKIEPSILLKSLAQIAK